MNPSLLTHPNIPKPLHSVNPRSIKGEEWWNKVRREAYAKHDFHCWACGVHKSKAAYHQWLEGHEHYDIDYPKGEVTLREIVALCHSCHNFIHSGRMWAMYKKGQMPRDKISDIVDHGLGILYKAKMKPLYNTLAIRYILDGMDSDEAVELAVRRLDPPQHEMAEWREWHLVLDGEKHYSPFTDIDEWRENYAA